MAFALGGGLAECRAQTTDESPAGMPAFHELSSPRETLRSFFTAMELVQAQDFGAVEWATRCLELTPANRARAESLAQQLYEFLDSLDVAIDSDAGDPRGPSYVWETGAGAVAFARDAAGEWRFSAATVEAIPDLHQARAMPSAQSVAGDGEADDVNRLSSPRDTMRTFIEAYNGGHIEAMLLCLDLSGEFTAIRRERGIRMADMLMGIINRTRFVVYQEIPRAPEKDYYVFRRHSAGSIAIAKTENGDWLFTPRTLQSLEDIYDAVVSDPLVPGAVAPRPYSVSIRVREWVSAHTPFLLRTHFLLRTWQWLGLLLVILAGVIAGKVLGFAFGALFRRFFRRRGMALDADSEAGVLRPVSIAVMAWIWWLGLNGLDLPDWALLFLLVAAKMVTGVGLVWALYKLTDLIGAYFMEKAKRTETKLDDLLIPLIRRSMKIFVAAFGVVFLADVFQLPLTSLLAGLGVGGLALGLAAKDTVENLFGSLTVLLDRPFQIGDWVIIGDVEGSVETVGIRSTRVRTFYNSMVTVPNAQLTRATVDNMGARRYRRYRAHLGIAYDTPPETIDAFCEGIRELIRRHPYTRKDYYHIYFNDFGDFSLQILVYIFHECPDWSTELRERHRLLADIVRLAHALGVEFAYPTQTLHLRREAMPEKPWAEAKPGSTEAETAGRNAARHIVESTLGAGAPVPPPVTFDGPVQDDETPEIEKRRGGDSSGT